MWCSYAHPLVQEAVVDAKIDALHASIIKLGHPCREDDGIAERRDPGSCNTVSKLWSACSKP